MFKSFFFAGFECATGINRHGQPFDQVVATLHDRLADHDYRLLAGTGLRAAREAVRWPVVDRGGRYDFSSVAPLLEAAGAHGIELIWDLFHFGYPDDVDLFSADFPRRFADYCHAAAAFVDARIGGPCYFTPVNEPSYFAWAAGEMGLFAPHARGRGAELKAALIRATIQGIDAIRAACARARIVNADPVCRVVPPYRRGDLQADADRFNQSIVFESWDMLAGRLRPELGGSRAHLDIPGINYYAQNQWVLTRPGVPLRDGDPRRLPLRALVRTVWERYGGDLLITETSHCDDWRGPWLREVAREAEALLELGVPLRGVCLYPVLGMPEWHDRARWARMGLWDLVPDGPALRRVPYTPMLEALTEAEGRMQARRLKRLEPRLPERITVPVPSAPLPGPSLEGGTAAVAAAFEPTSG